jgi:hypothetical protein
MKRNQIQKAIDRLNCGRDCCGRPCRVQRPISDYEAWQVALGHIVHLPIVSGPESDPFECATCYVDGAKKRVSAVATGNVYASVDLEA